MWSFYCIFARESYKLMTETTDNIQPKERRSLKRGFIGAILTVLLLLLLLPFTLYIPYVQDTVCRWVVEWLNSSSEQLEYHVGTVRIDFPLKLRVNDVTVLQRAQGDTLLSISRLRTGLDDLPIRQPYFIVNNLDINDVAVGMDSLTTSFGISGTLSALHVERIEVDPQSSELRVSAIELHQPDLALTIGPSQPDSVETDEAGWSIAVDRALVHDGKVLYDPFDFEQINLAAEEISYNSEGIHANLLELSLLEQRNDLELKHASTRFSMVNDLLQARDLDLRLAGEGTLRGDVQFSLGMLDSLRTGFAEADLRLAIDSANLMKLASPYLPNLRQYWIDATTQLNLAARLTPDSLDLRTLELRIPEHVNLMAEAFALSPFDEQERTLAATLKGDLERSDFLLSSLVATPSQRSYRLPELLSFDLEAAQRNKRLTARADVRKSKRDVLAAEAKYDVTTDSYHLTAKTSDFCVQDFLPSLPVEQMTLHAEADGRHFSFPGKWTRLEAELMVDSIGYRLPDGSAREQLYGVEAKASLLGGDYVAEIHSSHPTVQIHSHMEGIFLKDTLTVAGHFDAPHLDLAHLPAGLAMAELGQLSFCCSLDAAYNWGDVAEGSLRIDSLTYAYETTRQNFDNILVTLESRPGMLYADVTGGDATLCLNTERGISEFPQIVSAVSAEVGRQLEEMRLDFNALQQSLPMGMLDFHMAQDNPFYPAINYLGYQFNSIDMAAYNLFNLNLDACIVGLRNEDRTLDFDSVIAEVRPCRYVPKGDSLMERDAYRLNAHALHIDPKARDTYDILAHGMLMPDSVMMDVKYVDGNYVTLYDAAASLSIGNDTLTLRLERDPVLYAQPFTVNADNYICLMEYRNGQEHQRTNTSAKVLMKGPRGMALDIYTRKAKNRDIGNQMLVRLQNLDLDYASKTVMWEGDVKGSLNLTMMADLYPDSLGGQLRAGIRDFHLGDYAADTLSFDGKLLMAPDRRDMDGTLTIDSIVKLQVEAALADTLNLQVGINELPLPLANLYMPSNIRLDGTTSGKLSLRGKSLEAARMDAFITMHDAHISVVDLDGKLTLAEDTISIRNNRLALQDYRLYGVNNQPITLRGQVDMRKDLTNPTIDLRATGDNVLLAASRSLRLPDQYMYGRLPISPDIRVRGNLSDLNVTGKLQICSGTDLKYFLQEDPLQSTSKVDQLVEFVSFRQMDRELAHSNLRPLMDATGEGLSMELKIDIDRDVKVDAYLPGEDNNHVAIVGGGPLVMQCASDGSLTMSGAYDVTSGTVDYKLPVLPMTKKFNILNSSFVSWNGTDPGSPAIEIKASENVRTTVSDDDGTRIVQFVVTISITGTLDALDMSFTCSAPDDGSINSEIESMTEEERSKTALMLLVAQTYMGSSNRSSVGMGTANAALNSVLNRQMDQMLGSALQNTDVDLGIDTYSTEAGAARTDYSIKVSQRFFNDRFRATFGGRVSSGGDNAMGNGARLGDMSLEWLIKKDGTHYLKLYRRYNYQSVLEGEVVESGVAYAQERTAYKFKHLLIPTSKSRQERLQATIREMQKREEEEERQREESENEDLSE